jgi:hypothetical protein
MENYFIFEQVKKIIVLFTQNIGIKLSKLYRFGIRDLGSKRHRIPIPDPDLQHFVKTSLFSLFFAFDSQT